MTDFSRFTSRYDISGQLRLQAPVRIGTQKSLDAAEVNIPIVKDRTGNPVIPGSSLKGVLRSYIESILRTLQDRTNFARSVTVPDSAQSSIGKRNHVLSTEPMTMQDELNRDDTLSVELLKEWKALWEDDDTLSQEALDTLIIDATSLLQRVFGTMWVASKVYFRDCYPSDNRTVRSIYRDGVAIHRDRHVAQDGMLYNFEAIPAGASFDFHLTAENVDDVEVGVLMIGVRALSEGILRIGGGTSRGLGSVVLENIKIEYVGSDLDSLTDYLTSGAKQTIDYQDMAAKVNALMDYIREGAS